MSKYLSILFGLLIGISAQAQEPLHIAIISDQKEGQKPLMENPLRAEIEALLSTQYELKFTNVHTGGDVAVIASEINAIYDKMEADVVIGTGVLTSGYLSGLQEFPIPTIAGIILNEEVQMTNATGDASGIHNFTYIQSAFNIVRDLEMLQQIKPYEKVAIFSEPSLSSSEQQVKDFLMENLDANFEIITLDQDVDKMLSAMSDDVEAAYVISVFNTINEAQTTTLYDSLASKGLPAFSLLDFNALEYGAYAAFASSDNLQKIPRRIALNVMKIAEGQNPAGFSLEMESFTERLLINMKAVRKTGVYPSWEILDNATLLNINEVDTDRKLSLKSAIAEGLENNLGYKVAQKQTQIVQKDVAIAKSNYLPQLEVKTTGLFLDPNTVNSSFGSKGSFNWSAGASFSQLIISEPAMANIAIQKLLLESQKQSEKQSEMDVVLDVSTAYFNYLQSASVVQLQNDNISVKQKNLDIAESKQKVGDSGVSDVYRWQTELALAHADLNNSVAQMRTARFNLNQILNRPVDEDFIVDAQELSEGFFNSFDRAFLNLVDNPGDLEKFSDFMVMESMSNLPEIKQLEYSIKAQERLYRSDSRALFSPTVALSASYDHPLKAVNPGEPPVIPGIELNLSPGMNPTWNVGVVAKIPIVTGGSRMHKKQQSQVALYQLNDQRYDVKNKLELQVRANLNKMGASYNNLKLSQKAADSARKNVDIVEDLYKQGQVNVTTVIDAQNAALGAEINAANSEYQFMIDFFGFQRSTGSYFYFSTQDDRTELFSRFLQFKNN